MESEQITKLFSLERRTTTMANKSSAMKMLAVLKSRTRSVLFLSTTAAPTLSAETHHARFQSVIGLFYRSTEASNLRVCCDNGRGDAYVMAPCGPGQRPSAELGNEANDVHGAEGPYINDVRTKGQE